MQNSTCHDGLIRVRHMKLFIPWQHMVISKLLNIDRTGNELFFRNQAISANSVRDPQHNSESYSNNLTLGTLRNVLVWFPSQRSLTNWYISFLLIHTPYCEKFIWEQILNVKSDCNLLKIQNIVKTLLLESPASVLFVWCTTSMDIQKSNSIGVFIEADLYVSIKSSLI